MVNVGVDKQMLGISVFTAILLLLSACQGNTQTSQEIYLLYTAGAETVVSRLTQSVIRATPAPSQTMAPPTSIFENSSTATITPDFALSPTISPGLATLGSTISGITVGTSNSGGTLITNDRPDRCQWVEQDPPDNSTISANTGFTTTWVLQNFGTSTWNKQYKAVWYNANGSDRIGPGQPVTYNLTNDVAPKEVYRLKVDMQANLKPGKYYSLWGLQNSSGVTFCTFDLTINVK